jgi:Amt family ammonium transporter
MKKHTFILIILLSCIMLPLFSSDMNSTDETSRILIEQSKRIDVIQTDLDYVWVLICAALVFFMQAGFMTLEAGMARSKNSINVAIKNLTDFVMGVIGYWVVGFGIMFGMSKGGFFGTTDFLISIEKPWTAVFFLFQSVFVGTAATIDSGSVCERAKLKQYILLSLLLSIFIYPVFGHWVWGSFLHGSDPATGGMGWLEALGFKDFAGSSVVHSVGGWMALAGVIVVGPRIGKFETDPLTGKRGKANKIQPGDMRFVFLGTFILFFGWFGFNCGSTLAATPEIATIGLNTVLSSCFGCLVSSSLSWATHPEKKIEGGMIANGILGGLVAITAGCAFVSTFSAVIIGSIAGIVVFTGSYLLENVFKLDDVVDAVPVHGFCGIWGTLAVGFFIREDMLGELTRAGQIKVQFIGVFACFVWAFGLGLFFYFIVDKFFGGIRVSREDEMIGLNVAEHGATSSLLELANTMDDLTRSGEFEGHKGIAVDRGTEIGDLAMIFNKLISKISQALQESREQQATVEIMLKESERERKLTLEAQENLRTTRLSSDKKQQEYISNAETMVGTVVSRTEEIQIKMKNTNEVTEKLSQTSQKLTDTLGFMLRSLTGVFSRMKEVDSVTSNASNTAGNTRVTISELKNITDEITKMVNFINEIADKTHVLSINSAIEAARASDSGKGFTVIAKEVRKLSSQTSKTANDISSKVGGIEWLINKVVSSMDEITSIVGQIGNLNNEILSVISENQNYTQILEEQSKSTIIAMQEVSNDVRNVVDDICEVNQIGDKVKEGLKQMVP